MCAQSLQSCPILCNPMDCSPPGFSAHGILQARTLEWVAISSSDAWKWKVKVKSVSCVWLLATPWTAAYQAPPSMGFSRQEYWRGLPLPSPKWMNKLLQISYYFFMLDSPVSCCSSHNYSWHFYKFRDLLMFVSYLEYRSLRAQTSPIARNSRTIN